MASGVDAKLLKSTKFPPEYSKKVDREKVNLEVMKQFVFPSSLVSNMLCCELTFTGLFTKMDLRAGHWDIR
jgi:hypothetical protein